MVVWLLCRFIPMSVFCITEQIFFESMALAVRQRVGMNSRKWRFGFKMVSVGQANRTFGGLCGLAQRTRRLPAMPWSGNMPKAEAELLTTIGRSVSITRE